MSVRSDNSSAEQAGSGEPDRVEAGRVETGRDDRGNHHAAPPARVVLITGAARRIGRSLALGFAARGWDVAVHYGASRGEADEGVAEIVAMGRRAVALHAELGDEGQVEQLLPACMAALGRPSCIVNNASRF